MEDNKRNTNFTSEEIRKLMALVNKYKHIIENKKSDAVTWKEKQKIWVVISNQFNASNSGIFRTVKNIRGKYENLKKCAKKKFAAEKKEMYKTGGGSCAAVEITSTDVAIKEMLGVGIDGLVNEFDDDAVVAEIAINNEQAVIDNGVENWASWTPSSLRRPKSSCLSIENDDGDSENISSKETPKQIQHTSSTSSTTKLCTPTALPLAENHILQTPALAKDSGRKYKKKTDLTMDCRVKINSMSEAKLELIHLQKRAIEEEMNLKKIEHDQRLRNQQIEHELNVEEAKLRIQLLKNQLLIK